MNYAAHKALSGLLGPRNYLTGIEDRMTYASDASGIKVIPEAVLFPQSSGVISEILKIADQYRIPLVPRGAGTGLTGGAVASAHGLVLILSQFNRILEIDTDNLLAVVEPGVVTADLQAAVEKHGLFYPPDPASTSFCTIGGNIAENAGGTRAVKYGVTRNYVLGLEVVLASGEVIHTGSKCLKDVVGYDLTTLFVGSEGTLGIITQAMLKLLPLPETRRTLAALFPNTAQAAETVPALFKNHILPSCIEFMDHVCLRAVEGQLALDLPKTDAALLLIEVDGKAVAVDEDIQRIQHICRSGGAMEIRSAADEAERASLWRSRRSLHSALRKLSPQWEEEDVSVPVRAIPSMIARMEQIGRSLDLLVACFGHFGDGNLHISFTLKDDTSPDPDRLGRARHDILRAAVHLEGRIAAEHGIGLAKRNEVGWNLDRLTLRLMRNLKQWLDPKGILNPGKIFPDPEIDNHYVS